MARKKKISPEIKLEGPIEESNQKLETSGLGDVISNITSALGIEECEPCARRKAALNKAFPWLNPTRQATQDDIDFMNKINSSSIIQSDDVNKLFNLYNELFNSKLSRCNCPGLLQKMISRLNTYIIN